MAGQLAESEGEEVRGVVAVDEEYRGYCIALYDAYFVPTRSVSTLASRGLISPVCLLQCPFHVPSWMFAWTANPTGNGLSLVVVIFPPRGEKRTGLTLTLLLQVP